MYNHGGNHSQQRLKRPQAEEAPAEEVPDFLFDIEGEMAEASGEMRSVSLYVQPITGKRRTVVCKHWLRGLCKKGDLCDYLHEYDEDKMPICQFYFSDKVRLAYRACCWTCLNALATPDACTCNTRADAG